MPKLCTGCNETKSKSLFSKGRIVCKECNKDRKDTSIVASVTDDVTDVKVDEDVGVLAKVNIIYDTIPKIFEKLENISHELQNIHNKIDELKLQNTQESESISEKLDILSVRLGLVEESSAKIATSNALRNLLTRLIPIPPHQD
jgi:hypothetical protein